MAIVIANSSFSKSKSNDMATAEQVKRLVKAYISCDDNQFKTVVLQIDLGTTHWLWI